VLVWDIDRTGIADSKTVGNISLDPKTADASVDGGTGFDTLRMNGSSYDFTLNSGTTGLTNLEMIDLKGRNASTVVLSRAAVSAMTDASKTLLIDGDAGDRLVLSDWGDWTYQGETLINGGAGKIYTSTYGGQTVTVKFANTLDFTDKTTNAAQTNLFLKDLSASALTTGTPAAGTAASNGASFTAITTPTMFTGTVTGTAGADSLVLDARTANVAGGTGEDTLSSSAMLVDLTLSLKPTITGIDVFELGDNTNGMGNQLKLTQAQITAMTDNKILRVEGDWGDSLYLTGAWMVTTDLVGGVSYNKYVSSTDANLIVLVDTKVSVSYDTFVRHVNGDSAANTLTGGAGDDWIYALGGNDSIDGGTGNDSLDYTYTSSNITADLSANSVTVVSGSDVDTLANIENLVSGSGNDSIKGSADNNLLDGRAGLDTLDGGDGNDTLIGGAGKDRLLGGAGNDLLYYDATDSGDTVDGGDNVDTLAIADNLVDFTAASGLPSLKNLEVLDLQIIGGGFSNTVILSAAKVVAMTNSSAPTLRIDGQVGDVVLFSDPSAWALTTTSIGGVTYNSYSDSVTGAVVNVDPDISTDAFRAGSSDSTLHDTAGGSASLADYANQTGIVNYNLSSVQQSLDYGLITANKVQRYSSGTVTDTLSGIEWIKSGLGNDALVLSTTISNRVDMGVGNDRVYDIATTSGSNVADTLIGGAGNDTLSYDRATEAMTIDVVAGTATMGAVVDVFTGFDTFVSGSGNDVILDNSESHRLDGGAGNDTLDGHAGNDVLLGGDGTDLLLGGEGDDALYGNAGNNTLLGGDGNDTLFGQNNANDNVVGADKIDGGAGNDNISGGRSDDSIQGGDGNDYIHGGGENYYDLYYRTAWSNSGNDTIDGGTGNDTLYGDDGNDLVFGGDDNDYIGAYNYYSIDFRELGNDTFIGGAGNDTIVGGDGNDLIYGGDGNDTLGNDWIYEYGNDTFIGGMGNDIIDGGYDTDTLDYSQSTNSVQANLDDEAHSIGGVNLAIYAVKDGVGGTDTVYRIENILGGSANDILLGSYWANSISGNAGNDTIWGAEGADTLSGGDGNDVFFLDLADATVDGGADRDTIYTRYVNTDLTTASVALRNIEVVDLSANASGVGNTLVINRESVLAMTDPTNYTLTIDGEVGDSVFFTDRANWTEATSTSTSGSDVYRQFTSAYTVSTTTYNLVVKVKQEVSTDVVRGVAVTAETLSQYGQYSSVSGSDTLVTANTMADYADRIAAVRVNLSGVIDNGVAPRTAVTTAISGGAGGTVDVDTFTTAVSPLSQVEWVKTGSGDDWLVGSSVANRLEGGLGKDWLRGGGGDDTLVGGLDVDTADFSDADQGVTLTLNADYTGTATSAGSTGSDVLNSIENLVGSDAGDSITILDTNANWIDAGAGADTILAGAGDDTLIYDAADATVDGEAGTDTLVVRAASLNLEAAGSGTVLKNLEVIDLRGSQGTELTLSVAAVTNLSTSSNALTVYADAQDVIHLVGAWTPAANTVVGDAVYRNWTATGGVTLCISAAATVRFAGTGNADTVSASTGADWVLGLAGNDSLSAGNGDDTLLGGAGDDSLVGEAGTDTVDYSSVSNAVNVNLTTGTATGEGTDTLTTIERVLGSAFHDTLTGSANADTLDGQLGNDSLSGSDGNDVLLGQAGNDTLVGGNGADILRGGEGNDSLVGGTGADALYGDAGDDTLTLDLADGVVDGGLGNDTLVITDSSVNFVSGSDPQVTGFEVLDLSATNTAITLNLATVRALSGQSNQVWIQGGAGDTVNLTDWGNWSTSTLGSDTIYTQSGVQLRVTNGITVANATPTGSGTSLLGTDGSSTLTGGNANDTLQPLGGADTVQGGTGSDKLVLNPQFRVDTVSLSGIGADAMNNSFVVAVGDVNKDGLMDFAMKDANANVTYASYVYRQVNTTGWPHYSYTSTSVSLANRAFESGNVYVVYGSSSGIGNLQISSSEAPTGANASYVKLTSSASASEGFGNGLGSLGDFNGDGSSDFMVTAYGTNSLTYSIGNRWYNTAYSDSWSASSGGRLYMFTGGNQMLVDRESGSVTETTLSTNVGGATGQANALPTGASSPYWNSYANQTYTPQYAWEVPTEQTTYTYSTSSTKADVVYGGSGMADTWSGWAPVALGDLNADGFDDIMSGADGKMYFGRASLGSGFNANVSGLGTAVDIGDFGRIAPMGDIDGDGYQDLMVADPSGNTNYVVYGSATASSWTSATWSSNVGSSSSPRITKIVSEPGIVLNGAYSALGDINGDGYDDMLISAFGNSGDPNDFFAKNNGGLYVVFGQSGHWSDGDLSLANLSANQKGFRITGAVDMDKAGQYSWTGVGDMNGDGLDDFIFQAPGDNEAANASSNTALGSSYLIFGRQSGWQDINLLEMQDYGIQLLRTDNSYWTALGDVDGDGFDDVSLTNSNEMKILYGDAFLTGDSNMAVKHVLGTGGELLTADAVITNANAKGADRLIGNAGNDTLVGNGGADVLLGGAGNDLLRLSDGGVTQGAMGSFFKIDGGTGVDTLEFTSALGTANNRFDFSRPTYGMVENVEIFKLGTGNQYITLNHLDVLSITGDTNTSIDNPNFQKGHVLVIDGTSGDDVALTGGWNQSAVATNVGVNGSGSFSVYQHGSDNLYVAIADEVTKNIS
jgi:Ca2+-binding RTX toxin-like protein